MITVPGKEKPHIHQFAFNQPREPLSWDPSRSRRHPCHLWCFGLLYLHCVLLPGF